MKKIMIRSAFLLGISFVLISLVNCKQKEPIVQQVPVPAPAPSPNPGPNPPSTSQEIEGILWKCLYSASDWLNYTVLFKNNVVKFTDPNGEQFSGPYLLDKNKHQVTIVFGKKPSVYDYAVTTNEDNSFKLTLSQDGQTRQILTTKI